MVGMEEEIMLHRTLPPRGGPPVRRLRVLLEDPLLAVATFDRAGDAGVQINICSGPDGATEVCPLVADGTCPFGRCDVVVSFLDGPWGPAVAEAWRRQGVAGRRAGGSETGPDERFRRALGIALTTAVAPSLSDD